MGPGEFQQRVEAMADAFAEPERAGAELLALVAEVIAELEAHLVVLQAREERDRALAVEQAAFDAGKEGAARLRYEMAAQRVFRASLHDLRVEQERRAAADAGRAPNRGAAGVRCCRERLCPRPVGARADPR